MEAHSVRIEAVVEDSLTDKGKGQRAKAVTTLKTRAVNSSGSSTSLLITKTPLPRSMHWIRVTSASTLVTSPVRVGPRARYAPITRMSRRFVAGPFAKVISPRTSLNGATRPNPFPTTEITRAATSRPGLPRIANSSPHSSTSKPAPRSTTSVRIVKQQSRPVVTARWCISSRIPECVVRRSSAIGATPGASVGGRPPQRSLCDGVREKAASR